MKNYIYIIVAIIFLLFGGCTVNRKLIKSSSDLKIEKDIESIKEKVSETKAVNIGKTSINESSTVEEISIKKPINIELTANFRVDSTAFLRGDTALKLVDVKDKNVSITIYQNGKTKVLTARVKTLAGVQDVPFSEINIKKSTFNKSSVVDTTKTENIEVSKKDTYKDKSKLSVKESNFEQETKKVNYLGLIVLLVVIGGLFIYFYKKR